MDPGTATNRARKPLPTTPQKKPPLLQIPESVTAQPVVSVSPSSPRNYSTEQRAPSPRSVSNSSQPNSLHNSASHVPRPSVRGQFNVDDFLDQLDTDEIVASLSPRTFEQQDEARSPRLETSAFDSSLLEEFLNSQKTPSNRNSEERERDGKEYNRTLAHDAYARHTRDRASSSSRESPRGNPSDRSPRASPRTEMLKGEASGARTSPRSPRPRSPSNNSPCDSAALLDAMSSSSGTGSMPERRASGASPRLSPRMFPEQQAAMAMQQHAGLSSSAGNLQRNVRVSAGSLEESGSASSIGQTGPISSPVKKPPPVPRKSAGQAMSKSNININVESRTLPDRPVSGNIRNSTDMALRDSDDGRSSESSQGNTSSPSTSAVYATNNRMQRTTSAGNFDYRDSTKRQAKTSILGKKPKQKGRNSMGLDSEELFIPSPDYDSAITEIRRNRWEPPAPLKPLSKDFIPIYSRKPEFAVISGGDKKEATDQQLEDAALARKQQLVDDDELRERRHNIVREILYTEEQFCSSLESTINKYYKPMLEGCKTDPNMANVKQDDIHKIFSNLPSILPLNRDQFLPELKKRVNAWGPDQVIGDLFVKFGNFFLIYTTYSTQYDAAIACLAQISQQPWFANYCDAKVYVETELIKPIQRLPRYCLLLEDLWKHTTLSHPDNENLGLALGKVKKVAAQLNEMLSKYKNFGKLTAEGLEFLLATHRQFVMDDVVEVVDVTKSLRSRQQVLLFTDLIAFMHAGNQRKPVKEPKDLEMWPLQLVWLPSSKDSGNHTIELVGPCKVYSLHCHTPENWERWHQGLSNTLTDALRKTSGQSLTSSTSNATPIGRKMSSASLAQIPEIRRFAYAWNEACFYDGEWLNGKMHGEGCQEVRGSIYRGEFEDNLKSGFGILHAVTGDIYVGEFQNGVPHGGGEMLSCNATYFGQWRGGKRHGKGILVYKSGDRYDGHFEQDHFEGNGVFASASGCVRYTGQFAKGLFSGQGDLTTKAGRYTGTFEGGKFHGKGTMKYANSSIYTGQFCNGQPHDQEGTLQGHEGLYVGGFENGMKHGRGEMTYVDGSMYVGHWEKNQRHGHGEWEGLDGNVKKYVGDWKENRKTGKGLFSFTDKAYYEGAVLDDMPHGEGVLTIEVAKGLFVKYKAKWNHGVRDGKVQVTMKESETTNKDTKPPFVASLPFDDASNDLEAKLLQQHLVPPFLPVLAWTQKATHEGS